MIEDKWIDDVKSFVDQLDNNKQLPREENTETPQESEEPHPKSTWEQQAEFTIFFDYKLDKNGKKTWQTRVYNGESGDEPPFPGVEPSPWVNWILEKADLLDVVKLAPAEPEIAGSLETEAAALEETRIEIIEVQTTETDPSFGKPEKYLMAEIHFRVSGDKSKTLTADHTPFFVEILAHNLESKTTSLVSFGEDQLKPKKFNYTNQQEFPMPEVGRYEIHSKVFLLQSDEMIASHKGPIFRVIP